MFGGGGAIEGQTNFLGGQLSGKQIFLGGGAIRIPLLEDKYLKTKEIHSLFALLNVCTCDVTHQHGRHDVK